MTATKSPIEQLAEDLREKGLISVVYWEKEARHTVARYTDFVGNCAFFGIEGIASPRLVIRQEEWRTDRSDLQIPLGDILMVEIYEKHECPRRGSGCTERPKAWWCAPFGRELRRFSFKDE